MEVNNNTACKYNFSQKASENKNIMNSDKQQNEHFSDIVGKLKEAPTYKEANKALFDAVNSGKMAVKNSVLFKCDDYTVQTMFKRFAEGYIRNQKRISDLNLSIAPKYIDTIEKGNDVYIISQVPGTKTGDLIPFYQAKSLVSKEDLQQAFLDLKTLTKKGITDQNVLNGRMIFVTPDDHKVMIPSWETLRPVQNGEAPKVIEQYQKILFG